MKVILTGVELLFTLLSILLYSGGPIFLLLSQGYSEGSSYGLATTEFDFSLARNLFLLNYLITAGLLGLRWKQTLRVFCHEVLLTTLILFASLSLLWSVDPSITQNRAIALAGTTLFGLYLASRFTIRQQCYLIATAMVGAVMLSLFFVIFFPHYGIMGGTHTGAWRGIYTHKNQLGKMMSLTATLLSLLVADSRSHGIKISLSISLAITIGLLIMSQSTTALIIALFLILTLPLHRILRLQKTLVPSLLLTSFFLISSVYILVFNIEKILGWFQKDLTLTGRTQLWSVLAEMIARRPWLGYGFNGFWESGWDSPVVEVWRAVRWQAPSGHNSWVDICLELGFVGLVLCTCSFLLVLLKAMRWNHFSRTAADLWPLTLLSCIFLNSLTETTLLAENDIFWVLYSAVTFSLSAQRIPLMQAISPVQSKPQCSINPFGHGAFQIESNSLAEDDNAPTKGKQLPIHSIQNYGMEHALSNPSRTKSDLAARLRQEQQNITFSSPTTRSNIVQRGEQSRQSALQSTEATASRELSNQSNSSSNSPTGGLAPPSSLFNQRTRLRMMREDIIGLISFCFRQISLLGQRLIKLDFAGRAAVDFAARIIRVGVQASYFILLTRTLSIQEYGIFTSVVATVSLVAPFAGLGAEHLIVRNLARDRQGLPLFFGHALSLSFIFSTMLTIMVTIASYTFFSDKVSPIFTILIAISDLFFLKVISICKNIFLTLELSFEAAIVNLSMSLKNLAAISVFMFWTSEKTLLSWAACYCIGTIITATLSLIFCITKLHPPHFSTNALLKNGKEGLYFSIGQSAYFVNSNIDKTMLLRLGTSTEVGIYSAAYRIITIAFTPMLSIMSTSYAKFFSRGSQGLRGSLRFAMKIMPFTAGYGIFSSLFLAFFAPLAVQLFGNDYTECVVALRWLSPLLFIQSIKFLLEDSLTGAGLQRPRSLLQIAAAFINIILNLLLLPSFSWKGAAWSSLASETFLILGVFYLVLSYYNQEKAAKGEV